MCCRSHIVQVRSPAYPDDLSRGKLKSAQGSKIGSAPDLTAGADPQFAMDGEQKRSLTPSMSLGQISGSPMRPHRLPPYINKELDKRKIGKRYVLILALMTNVAIAQIGTHYFSLSCANISDSIRQQVKEKEAKDWRKYSVEQLDYAQDERPGTQYFKR